MRIADASLAKMQEFFRQYFADENLILPVFQVHYGRFSRSLCRVFKISGITVERHVFIDPVFLTIDRQGRIRAPFELMIHEATHVLQYARYGLIGFLFSYLKEWSAYLKNAGKRDLETRWQAYYAITHEVEARRAAEAYRLWRKEQAKTEKNEAHEKQF